MRRWYIAVLVGVLLSGCTLVKVYLRDEVRPLEERVLSGTGAAKVLIVDISGLIATKERAPVIGDAKKPGLLTRLREELDRARADGSVKAVVLRINSPGGTVAASDLLYHEISIFKKDTGTAVVAHLMDVGTSGAYYAALASDRIVAQPTTITGSIGVVLYRLDATGLMQKIGINAVEIASGERKGMGSPARPLSQEEKRIFQGIVDDLYGRFLDVVSERRGIERGKAGAIGDGRIFTSRQAKEIGLIDRIGYLDDAIGEAKALAGISEARVVTYERPGEYRANIYAGSVINIELGAFAEPGMHFLYLWWP